MKQLTILVISLLVFSLSVTASASDRVAVQLLSGELIQVAGQREKPLYLKFWASWCGKCLAQMPHLQAIHEAYGEKIDIIAVNFGLNETREQIAQIQQKFGMTMPIGFDEFGELSRFFNVEVIPFSIIINRDGSIAYRGWGDKGVDKKITTLIGEGL